MCERLDNEPARLILVAHGMLHLLETIAADEFATDVYRVEARWLIAEWKAGRTVTVGTERRLPAILVTDDLLDTTPSVVIRPAAKLKHVDPVISAWPDGRSRWAKPTFTERIRLIAEAIDALGVDAFIPNIAARLGVRYQQVNSVLKRGPFVFDDCDGQYRWRSAVAGVAVG